jgi:hypothetical protein
MEADFFSFAAVVKKVSFAGFVSFPALFCHTPKSWKDPALS